VLAPHRATKAAATAKAGVPPRGREDGAKAPAPAANSAAGGGTAR